MLPVEETYGVIIVFRNGNEYEFLLLQHNGEQGSWTFPKGHHEGNETPKETALRELNEETGILEVELLDIPLIHEEYKVTRKNGIHLKTNEYFIGFVKEKTVIIQESEIKNCKWVLYQEAFETIQYVERREALKQAKKYLDEYDKRTK